jgi:hypothetical protein
MSSSSVRLVAVLKILLAELCGVERLVGEWVNHPWFAGIKLLAGMEKWFVSKRPFSLQIRPHE